MQKNYLYFVFDSVAEKVAISFFAVNDKMALRNFNSYIKSLKLDVSTFDFKLYRSEILVSFPNDEEVINGIENKLILPVIDDVEVNDDGKK